MKEITVEFLTNNMDGKLRKSLVRDFHPQLNLAGTFVFRQGSDEEARFRTRLKGFDVAAGIVIKCTDESLQEFPYFYFHAKYQNSLLPSGFILRGSGCLTEEPPLCWIASIQDRQIPVDLDELKGVDLASPDFITSPAITVVSNRCKELLQEMNVTGCRFIPCVDAKELPNSPIRAFARLAHASGEEIAAFYQLVILASVKKLPCIGKLLSVSHRCEKCHAVGGYSATKMIGEFNASDLNEYDFQTYHGFQDEGGREYRHKVEQVIVSSRILQGLTNAGMKGLDVYGNDPLIHRAVVMHCEQ